MKKLLSLLTALAIFVGSFAATIDPEARPTRKASEIMIPIGKHGEKISLLDLSYITVKDYETVSGKDLRNIDKIGFKLAQRELRKSISTDGTINKKRLSKVMDKMADGTSGFHVGGFALGFLLGLLGVLIAYLINDDKKRNRVKWTWIGLGVSLVLYLALVL